MGIKKKLKRKFDFQTQKINFFFCFFYLIVYIYRSKIYIAPSGVQKERVTSQDMFIYDLEGNNIVSPCNTKLTPSACTPLFFNAYTKANAGACIHT